MIGRSNKDLYCPCKEEEESLNEQYPHFTAVGALLYLATSIKPDITFAISIFAKHSAHPKL